MAIGFRAAGTVQAVSQPATITPTAPAGTVSTDVVITIVAVSDVAAVTITPPSGWTLVTGSSTVYGSGAVQGRIAAYWALGSATFGAYTINNSDGVGVAFCLGYTGVDNTTPIDVDAAGQSNASSTTGTAPSITTVNDNCWFICAFGFCSNSTFTDGSGITHRASGGATAAVNGSGDGADSNSVLTPAGATGTHTTTATVAAVNGGITVALRLDGAGAGNPEKELASAFEAEGVYGPVHVVGTAFLGEVEEDMLVMARKD